MPESGASAKCQKTDSKIYPDGPENVPQRRGRNAGCPFQSRCRPTGSSDRTPRCSGLSPGSALLAAGARCGRIHTAGPSCQPIARVNQAPCAGCLASVTFRSQCLYPVQRSKDSKSACAYLMVLRQATHAMERCSADLSNQCCNEFHTLLFVSAPVGMKPGSAVVVLYRKKRPSATEITTLQLNTESSCPVGSLCVEPMT
eukprot:363790-Chlamydomonas_euryale.AAC.23